MAEPGTTSDNVAREFPDTTWGLVSRLGSGSRREGLENLARRYWKPIYHFIRAAWAKSREDAKDLTQAFVLWLIESDALDKYRPEKGGFRPYLKSLLRHFVAHQNEAMARLKRGGGVHVISLDGEDLPPDAVAAPPEEAFDGAWVAEILRRAVEHVRKRLATQGRAHQVRAFELYDMSPPDKRPTYAALATQLGVKETDISNYLFAVREEIREEVRRELADTLDDVRDVDREWRALFGG